MEVFLGSAGNLWDVHSYQEVFLTFELAAQYLKEREGLELKEDGDWCAENEERWISISKQYLWGASPEEDEVRYLTKMAFNKEGSDFVGQVEVVNGQRIISVTTFDKETLSEKTAEWNRRVEEAGLTGQCALKIMEF